MVEEGRLVRFAHALGCYQTAWRFADADLRSAATIVSVARAWEVYRRDAGAGAVGRAHEGAADDLSITVTNDDRRDAVLLWLSDHTSPPVEDGARQLARMVRSSRRFGVDEQVLLDTARDAVQLIGAKKTGTISRYLGADTWSEDGPLAPLRTMIAAVDILRTDPDFGETAGAEARIALPTGVVAHYVPAEPGAAWALNLAMFTIGGLIAGAPAPAGLASRALFRSDMKLDALARTLIDGAAHALELGYASFQILEQELRRGRDALTHLSRNARTRDAWLLVVALRSITRGQIGRALGLSRAGADIQARTLSNAGLATLGAAGRIRWCGFTQAEAPFGGLDSSLAYANAELDDAMARIDHLLARTTPGAD